MTIKNLYPKARPQTIYNVINGRPELPAASTFSRASEATYVDSSGIIRTAAVDEPRFNYDPETGEFLGLLLETSRTNYFRNSETLTPATALPNGTTVTLESGISNPLGQAQVPKLGGGKDYTAAYMQCINSPGSPQSYYTFSCYAKPDPVNPCPYFQLRQYRTVANSTSYAAFVTFDTTTGEVTQGGSDILAYSEDVGNGWRRYVVTGNDQLQATSASSFLYLTVNRDGYPNLPLPDNIYMYVVGAQMEATPGPMYVPSSVIVTTTGNPVTRAKDEFSLTTSSNFDGGFSLLLDSETTTDDYFYKIKASGTTIAELNNANGTLDWVINGESAAINGEYPQVGAIQPGRVRTISSFGAADGTTQQNYLYTEGLSFPTNAIVASGADEVEFGPGQTLKAVYLWNGQLSNTEAVSVIKGEYNVVPNEPIKADSYSFVYNTDPTTVGEATISLPYIVPTVSMRVYWGDGTNSAYEQGVTPSHTYPYPGQYRIQIEADDGFDAVRLGDISNTIYRVDQWAPQHRVGAAGDGFTGDDLYKILATQGECALIPPFKYTDLTDLNQAFWNCQKAAVNNWDWIPTDLQSATNLNSAFRTVSRTTMSVAERGTFPQLQTGTALTSLNECFRFNNFTQFDQGNSGLPFSNTQNVTNWSGCFRDLANLTAIGSLDTSAATTLSSTFNGCNNLAAMPFITTNNVTSFQSTWQNCSSLTSFPQINTSSGITFSNAWNGCTNLTSFPQINTSSGTAFQGAWLNCSGLTSFPLIDTSNGTDFGSAWQDCSGLTSFPLLDTSSGANFYAAWYNCDKLTSFPLINTATGTAFSSSWSFCSGLTSFPAIDTSSGTNFYKAWQYCTNMTDFPANMFDTTGTLKNNAFGSTWLNCALTAQSIENILVSLDTNGQSNIELGIDGGTNAAKSTWTAAANTAYTNLINKGWTITFNP